MTAGFLATDRAVLRLTGADARPFLQGLVTNDLRRLDAGGPVYAALLTPQGKYLFDFFLLADTDSDAAAILIDVKADRAAALAQRLAIYRLRSAVTIEPDDRAVVLGTGDPPAGALPDPRDPGLGWRALTEEPQALLAGMEHLDPAEYDAARIALGVPETGLELIADESYILELGFERLHGVDFRKGCYVGQEVTARMKHKAALRKGLARVAVEGAAPPPGTPVQAGAKAAGTLFSSRGGQGLAHLRFDRAEGELRAGAARVTLIARAT